MSTSVSRLAPIGVAIFLGTALVVVAPACGDDEPAGTGGGGTGGDAQGDTSGSGAHGNADVIYEGGATDEALAELEAAGAPTTNAAETASFTAPLADAALPAATPAAFTWALPAQGSRLELLPQGREVPGPLERSATAALGLLLSGVREAHAHGDPVNGRAFFVVFSTAAEPELVRVFTTASTYTPDDAAWTALKGAAAPITATITSAVFESNRVAADGGPFTGGTVTFTITP
jgi:hypothetical protein